MNTNSGKLAYSTLIISVLTLMTFVRSPLDAQHNGVEPALEFANPGDRIVVPGGMTVPADSDVELRVWLFPTAWLSGNPGLWRAGFGEGNPNDGTFNIFQGDTGRPWVRWGQLFLYW